MSIFSHRMLTLGKADYLVRNQITLRWPCDKEAQASYVEITFGETEMPAEPQLLLILEVSSFHDGPQSSPAPGIHTLV